MKEERKPRIATYCKCSHCGKEYTNLGHYGNHIKTHMEIDN